MFVRTAVIVALLAVAGLVQASPKILKKVPPEFPADAMRKNITAGTVRAKLLIGADGKVSEVEVVEAEPKRVFDRAAVDALREWRFEGTGDKQTHEVKLVFRNDD